MIVLPISLICALILGFLLARLWIVDRRVTPVSWLLLICAMQSLIIALAQYYGWPVARLIQPIGACAIPPVAWLAFVGSAIRPVRRADLFHAAGPVTALLALALFPPVLDLMIPFLFLGYGIAILWVCRGGADALPQLRLDAASIPRRIWVLIAGSLILSAINDGIIVWSITNGFDGVKSMVISLQSALTLTAIGVLTLSDSLKSTPPETAPEPETLAEDAEILDRPNTLMANNRPYLNPNLTLIKLARKLGVPSKRLSAAVNRATGDNVSRYINASRNAAAQQNMRNGDAVTQAMLSSGFNTKSNFNREFARITGQSPSAWLTTQDR